MNFIISLHISTFHAWILLLRTQESRYLLIRDYYRLQHLGASMVKVTDYLTKPRLSEDCGLSQANMASCPTTHP
jgi:hypothetical protein